jgi:hypothetical protein
VATERSSLLFCTLLSCSFPTRPPTSGAIREQQTEADRLNRKYGKRFRIFKGIESDIVALDYPDKVLKTFDFVVASVHSRFKMDRAAQTERIIRAVSNPYTTILGHMTGRQLLRRPGYDIDIEKVLVACVEHGGAVEINANPWRLDLDWRWHERALRLGCLMSINPDAHSTRELDLTHWVPGPSAPDSRSFRGSVFRRSLRSSHPTRSSTGDRRASHKSSQARRAGPGASLARSFRNSRLSLPALSRE